MNRRAAGVLEVAQPGLGDSQMARLVEGFDWSQTALGPRDSWSRSLTGAVALCLHSPFQMAVYWGEDLNCVYNDAEREVLGDLHPDALGMPARELLDPSWEIVGPQLNAVMTDGTATWAEDQPLISDRRGRPEVGYFTYSYSPIHGDDGAIGGVLCVTQDTTARVLAGRARSEERRRSQADLRTMLNDLRAAQRRVTAAGDAERRRIARNLHDGAQQRLMAIRLELRLLGGELEAGHSAPRDEVARRLDELCHELDEGLEELRELAHGLYPQLLASDGLQAALDAAARRSPVPVMVQAIDLTRAPRSIESTAYFCCLEAVQNAVKHGGPEVSVTIRLAVQSGTLTFRVSDDGAGFDTRAVRPGYGLINLRDRLEALGGQYEVVSDPGRGTTIIGRLPLP
jgi:signal transduction histidine kinase